MGGRSMKRKRSLEGPSETTLAISKDVAARLSPVLVSVVSHQVPEEMCKGLPSYIEVNRVEQEFFFYATGMILECQASDSDSYLCTVLTPASQFKRPSNINLDEIKIDVLGSTGILYNAKLLASDFHYNLALLQFISDSRLPTVTLTHIDVYNSVDPIDTVQPQPRPHPNSFKIVPGTEIYCVSLGYNPPFPLFSRAASFSSLCPSGFRGCNELYGIKNKKEDGYHPGYKAYAYNGSPVMNSSEQIIGIFFNTCSFLPSNIVARWWNHYKSSGKGKFRRPLLGLEVANLHEARVDFLEQFVARFPSFSISAAVIVTKVEDNSRACSWIRTDDVIVKLDGKQVMSRLEFFETIWENIGQSVDYNVLRVTDVKELNVSFVIDEATPDKFHRWPHPDWGRKWFLRNELD